jgi:hypothetical protein
MAWILQALDTANQAGCKPYIHGAERLDGFSTYHIGASLKPTATKAKPWVSKDTIQSSNSNSSSHLIIRMDAMVKLCFAIDSVLNTQGQKALKRHNPRTLTQA